MLMSYGWLRSNAAAVLSEPGEGDCDDIEAVGKCDRSVDNLISVRGEFDCFFVAVYSKRCFSF